VTSDALNILLNLRSYGIQLQGKFGKQEMCFRKGDSLDHLFARPLP
jgi:hypothetical protein